MNITPYGLSFDKPVGVLEEAIKVMSLLWSTTKPVDVTSRANARVLTGLMRAVVTQGTGTQAALPGVQVAGKTGTAELGPKPGQPTPHLEVRPPVPQLLRRRHLDGRGEGSEFAALALADAEGGPGFAGDSDG